MHPIDRQPAGHRRKTPALPPPTLDHHNTLARTITTTHLPQLKQDLVASGNLEREFPDWPVWSYAHGHPPGIPVGRTFVGRGELMAAGVMSLYYQGISQK